MTRRTIALELFMLTMAAWLVTPLWLVEFPPIQDLPQHLAAMRVLADFDDPSLGFARYFEVELLRTQYLAYYGVVRALALVMSVELANRVVLTLALMATPYAMRALLRALGRDEAYWLFVLPLTYNAHLILGFLNFVAALPLALYGLALAAQLRHAFSRRRAIGLGLVTLLTFYTHVVPFAFLGLGAALMLIGGDWRETLKRWAALVPAALAALVWMAASPAGRATAAAAGGAGDAPGPRPQFMSAAQNLQQAPGWLTDVFAGDRDIHVLVAWIVLVMLVLAVGATQRGRSESPQANREARMLVVVAALAPLAALGYFVLPASYDWIWPINARFPLLALLFVPVMLPTLKTPWRAAALAFAVTLGLVHTQQARAAFVAFETDEVGALDEAIAHIPEGSRTAGLIFDRGSRHVAFSPFIHGVAWVQARRGGAVMFTFMDFPQSPVLFREDNRPPRVPPRWEWMPERVVPERDLTWYDHVLVRGGPGRIARSGRFEEIWSGPRWRVYRAREAE